MLTGERRFVSARRGSMIVLGKVSVPKPVNLPSQRLENQGLDPNVEIVPKGTLSWGSRSSSSAPNAWGSSALSPPNTGGCAGSPSHLNGRPSSGGSGTRPSTAGSEKSHEPVPNAWGPSSRPSSASGVLASNQASMATMRPHSAETRPGSSQLSRFAEHVSENSVAWGASGTTERLGASSFKISGFTLSSGDFPTLGSEKITESHVQQGHSSQGRPVSASGRVATPKERTETSPTGEESIDACTERGTVNTWKRESSSHFGGGPPLTTEKWQRETQPYPNHYMHPQHFDPWPGSPVRNSPDGVWYRGGPSGGPTYGPPGPPGSYPLEQYAYYHPQLPARPLVNSQPVPQPGSIPSGYHPKNGDSYRTHMPDSYIQPVMPVRPVYPAPVPYDGYYGPPHSDFCNSSGRDAPIMGMAASTCVYNRYPNQNIQRDSGNFHAIPGGYGPASTPTVKEEVESSHPHDTHRGPYRVLLKQRDDWEENDGVEKREHPVSTNTPYLEGGNQLGTPMKENDGGAHRREDRPVDSFKTAFGEEVSSQPAETRGGNSSVPVGVNFPESTCKAKVVDDSLMKKPETAAIPGEGSQQFLSTKRNPTLIAKIEDLNTKARTSDGQYDVGRVSTGEEKVKRSRVVNAKADNSTNEAGTGAVFAEKASISSMLIPTSHEAGASTGDKILEPTASRGTLVSRPVGESQASACSVLNSSEGGETVHSHILKRAHGAQARVNYRGKGRYNTQEVEEWRKKSLVADSSIVVPVTNVETCAAVHVLDRHAAQEDSEESDTNLQGKAGGELYATSASDPSDCKAQRAKMREIATQRAKQLQKEEEERTREQKAKAHAKLEELNRRTVVESSTQKLDHALPLGRTLQHKQETTQSNIGQITTDSSSSSEVSSSALGWNSDAVTHMNENHTNRLGESTYLLNNVPIEAPLCAPQEPVVTHKSSLPLPREVNIEDVADRKTAQGHYSSVSKQKLTGHRKKQNISLEKNSSDKAIHSGTIGGPKSHANVVADANALTGESNLPSNTDIKDDTSLQHKKKYNRNGKNKHKSDEVPSAAPLPSPADGNPAKASAENSKAMASESAIEVSSFQGSTSRESAEGQDSQDLVPSPDQGWSVPTEEVHGIVTNHGKSQPSRRMPRNTQASRSTEKYPGSEAVVWAPVRSLNNKEASEEASHNTTIEAHTSMVKNGHGMQNNRKSRRAEMERYVPKPVAKELSQEGNTRRPSSPSFNQAVSAETGRAESGSLSTVSGGHDALAIGEGGCAIESKNGESKHNKHGKTHGSWRQRGSSESPLVPGFQEGSSFSSDPSKIIQKSTQQHQPQKTETYSPKGQAKNCDTWSVPNNPISTEPVTGPVVKDHGVTSKGKRQPFKGHKATGHGHNAAYPKDLHGGDTDKSDTQSSAVELSQSDARIALRENQGVGEHVSSQWQPKSQAYSAHNRQGSRSNGGQRVSTQVGRTSEKEFAPQGGGDLLGNDKDNSAALVQPHPYQSGTQKANVAEVSNVRHQEAKRERKAIDSFKEAVHSPNQGPVNSPELAPPANVDTQCEQSFSSGLRRHGHNNGRRGQEVPHGGWSPVGQDNSKQQHLPANGGRQRQNSHYEYQQTGAYSNKPNELFEEGSRFMGSRYRERGQTHSRRDGGNFYGRNSGTVRVAAASGNGE